MATANGKKGGELIVHPHAGRPPKSSVKSSVRVWQPHGGALVPGAGGGRQPGAGRPPSEIRQAARLAFAERLHVLTEIADHGKRDADRIAAMKALGDIGGVDKLALPVMTPERLAESWEQLEMIKSIHALERLLVSSSWASEG